MILAFVDDLIATRNSIVDMRLKVKQRKTRIAQLTQERNDLRHLLRTSQINLEAEIRDGRNPIVLLKETLVQLSIARQLAEETKRLRHDSEYRTQKTLLRYRERLLRLREQEWNTYTQMFRRHFGYAHAWIQWRRRTWPITAHLRDADRLFIGRKAMKLHGVY
ncbi:hypothetical protein LTR50_002619 [Elasticomyces elasticus]|nr:hypothetical protein LTR50_002619 [Elasticomyces elasticus]